MQAPVVAFTSIPPRFAQLAGLVAALRGQSLPPSRIIAVLPRRYRRFPGNHALCDLPGVEILRPETDPGPAGKALVAARALTDTAAELLYCDDDWSYGPGWIAGFAGERARLGPGPVIAGAGFHADRLGLACGPATPRAVGRAPGHVDIAQGFGGVMHDARHLARIPMPHGAPWAVDDIWLSAHLAAAGHTIWQGAGLRAMCTPRDDPGNLQDSVIGGLDRAAANRAAAHALSETLGVWR